MDLKGLTAVELGKKIQAKEVTVKEAVEACFAQNDKVEKEVNSLPVAPVRQLRLWKYHMLLDLTPADRSVSQVLTAESLESSQPTERYPVMD